MAKEERMNTYPFVIVGGGVVAGYAAQEFTANGLNPGELCIISAESTLPYERPPLSKEFLAGKSSVDDILINTPEFYEQNGIEVWLNTVVGRVDFERKLLFTTNGLIGYEKLLIATGSRPRHLNLPGYDLIGIHYLRRVEDAQRILESTNGNKTALVIGGGFIGLEVSAVLQSSGLHTTLIFKENRVYRNLFTPEMSAFFEDYYRKRGVNLRPGVRIQSIEGEHGVATHVTLESGEKLYAGLIVAGIGVESNTEIFASDELELNDGILVDRFLKTNVPDVYAAGDVARYKDEIYDRWRRFEHWDNAVNQARIVARNMLGIQEPYMHIPYFFSDVFDLSYEFWGDNSSADQSIVRGKMESGSFSVWWLREEQLIAAFLIDRPDDEREVAPEWIDSSRKLSPILLADEQSEIHAAEIQVVSNGR
jgi:3-phenylpropionate/trans-cinnamate dioxygenase ferredoxin reductase subunit